MFYKNFSDNVKNIYIYILVYIKMVLLIKLTKKNYYTLHFYLKIYSMFDDEL